MANMEFTVTDSCYASALSEPATYTNAGGPITLQVVPSLLPDINIDSADIGARGKRIPVRVRKADVAQPVKGDTVDFYSNTYRVDDWDELNDAEWLLYVTA